MGRTLAVFLAAAVSVSARADDLFVSSILSDEVLRFDGATGSFISAFVPSGSGGLDGPQGIAFGPDGNLYVAAEYSHAIHKYDGATGASLGTLAIGLSAPNDITFGPDGLLYYMDHGSDRVRRYNVVTGVELAPIMLSDGTHHSHALTFGPDGLLYIGLEDSGPSTIRRLNPVTLTDMGTFATLGPGMAGIFGLEFLPGGDLIVTDSFAGSIRRINGVSGIELPPFAPPGSISSPLDMSIGPDGLLYVCSGGLGVQRFDPVTGVSLGGFISGGMGPGRSPFAPDWHAVPGPGALAALGLATLRRRRR